MTKVAELMSRLRDLVNAPRKVKELLSERKMWDQLCSAMDVIEDTELAMSAYAEGKPSAETDGERYLLVFGILQTLVVQQDALRDLAGALGVRVTFGQSLSDIRDIRVNAIGHPTNAQRGKSHNVITRITLSRSGFQLVKRTAGGQEDVAVQIPDLVAAQREEVARVLTEAIAALETEEVSHRRSFRPSRLASAFEDLNYPFAKVSEAIWSPVSRSIGIWGLERIGEAIREFASQLKERGVFDAYSTSVGRALQGVEHPMVRLGAFLTGEDASFTAKDAEVFARALNNMVDDLRFLAIEIDQEYESDQV